MNRHVISKMTQIDLAKKISMQLAKKTQIDLGKKQAIGIQLVKRQ